MSETILPRRATIEMPIATNDLAHANLVADPAVSQFQAKSFNQQLSSNFGNTQNINQTNSQAPVLSGSSPTNAASGADVLVDNTNTNWINNKWRPAMGWMYMFVCITDFVLFPILWSVMQAIYKGNVTAQWQPLTLQGAGLFHLAMGAVLGIAAYGRTKEKIENLK